MMGIQKLYLTDDEWAAEVDGGALRIHVAGPADAPAGATLTDGPTGGYYDVAPTAG